MANTIKQFRYYNEAEVKKGDKSNNYPQDATMEKFANGDVFKEANCFPISQLGIQAIPGTRFYLNNSDMGDYIIVGQTGIFELDLSNQTEITAIQFEMNSMEAINANPNANLIVDIIYDNGEG